MPFATLAPGSWSETQRLAFFTRVLAGSTLFCLAFCWKLWLDRPIYPLVPIGGLIPALPHPVDYAALGAFVGLLFAILLRPRWRVGVWIVLAAFASFFLQDQNRTWPSFYQFFVLFLLLANGRDRGDDQDAARVLTGMRFVLAAIYFWAGVAKLNVHFFTEEFPWFLEPITDRLPVDATLLPKIAPLAAVLEMLTGVGLLTKRFRLPALVGALAMHSLILLCIGPLRGGWSNSSWAWGMTVAVQTVVLFAAAPPFQLSKMFAAQPRFRVAPAVALLLIGVLPVLNRVNRWDSALSFNVYSGNISIAEIVVRGDAIEDLPAKLQEHTTRSFGVGVLSLNDWSLREFNSHVYPENRVFLAIYRRIYDDLPEGAAELHVREKASWFAPKQVRIYEYPLE